MPQLRISADGREVRIHELIHPLTIGRAEDCDVCVDDRRLSRRHCRIEPSAQGWVLIDLASTNGTFFDGQRVRERLLAGGDLLRAGSLALQFENQSNAAKTLDDEVLEMLREASPSPALDAAGLEELGSDEAAVDHVAHPSPLATDKQRQPAPPPRASAKMPAPKPTRAYGVSATNSHSLWDLASARESNSISANGLKLGQRAAAVRPQRKDSARTRTANSLSATHWLGRILWPGPADASDGHSKWYRRRIPAPIAIVAAALIAVGLYLYVNHETSAPGGAQPVLRPHHSRTDD